MKRRTLLGLTLLLASLFACGGAVEPEPAPGSSATPTDRSAEGFVAPPTSGPRSAQVAGQCGGAEDLPCPKEQYCVYPNGRVGDGQLGICVYPSKEGERCEQNQVGGYRCAEGYACVGGGDDPGPGLCRWR